VDLGAVVKQVLYCGQSTCPRLQLMNTNVIVIRLAHPQTAGSFGPALAVAVARYAFEGVATPPLAAGAPDVPLQPICLCEVVP